MWTTAATSERIFHTFQHLPCENRCSLPVSERTGDADVTMKHYWNYSTDSRLCDQKIRWSRGQPKSPVVRYPSFSGKPIPTSWKLLPRFKSGWEVVKRIHVAYANHSSAYHRQPMTHIGRPSAGWRHFAWYRERVQRTDKLYNYNKSIPDRLGYIIFSRQPVVR